MIEYKTGDIVKVNRGNNMSYYVYEQSRAISKGEGVIDPSIYALIMSAMRKADSSNTKKLKGAYPELWEELNLRYNSPGGFVSKEEAMLLAGDEAKEYIKNNPENVKFPKEGFPYG